MHSNPKVSKTPKARIYQPARSTMQAGLSKTKKWILDFEPSQEQYADPLMGWTGSANTLNQLRMTFPTLEEAISFAKTQGLDYEILPTHKPLMKPKNYTSNFLKRA